MKAAADRCEEVLEAWSIWTKTQNAPQPLIDEADAAFDEEWANAEGVAAMSNVDCVDMTLSGADMKALMDTRIDDIVAEVNDGLDLGVKKQAICGSKILTAAAAKCQELLHAESSYIKGLSLDPDGAKRDAAQARASSEFSDQWDDATSKECPTTASEEEIEGKVDALSGDVVTNTIVSPNVPDDAFMAITHPAGGEPGNEVSYEGDTLIPQCQDSSAFTFFAKRGSVNKLLMYYYGGGACWDTLTCVLRRCTQNANPNPPGLGGWGFGDLTNPDNPRQRQAGREVGAGALPEPDRHVRHRFERGLLRRDGARRPSERGLSGLEHQRDGRRGQRRDHPGVHGRELQQLGRHGESA
jgi:hypothetical protein